MYANMCMMNSNLEIRAHVKKKKTKSARTKKMVMLKRHFSFSGFHGIKLIKGKFKATRAAFSEHGCRRWHLMLESIPGRHHRGYRR